MSAIGISRDDILVACSYLLFIRLDRMSVSSITDCEVASRRETIKPLDNSTYASASTMYRWNFAFTRAAKPPSDRAKLQTTSGWYHSQIYGEKIRPL